MAVTKLDAAALLRQVGRREAVHGESRVVNFVASCVEDMLD